MRPSEQTHLRVVADLRIDQSVAHLRDNGSAHRENIECTLKLSTSYESLSDCDCATVCVSSDDENKLVLGQVEGTVGTEQSPILRVRK